MGLDDFFRFRYSYRMLRMLGVGMLLSGGFFALGQGIDPSSRLLFALLPLVGCGLLGLAWKLHRQPLPNEAYTLLSDHPETVPPAHRPEPGSGNHTLDAAARVIAYAVGESMFP